MSQQISTWYDLPLLLVRIIINSYLVRDTYPWYKF